MSNFYIQVFFSGNPIIVNAGVSRLNLANADAKRTPEYITMYFMPMEASPQPIILKYSHAMPIVRNDMPKQFLNMANAIDFSKVSDSESFKIEAKILADSNKDLLLANKEIIRYSMEEIFNRPRNIYVDKHARSYVGSYIFEKFTRYGLFSGLHEFLHERPINKYADIIGQPMEVCIFVGLSCAVFCDGCRILTAV